MARNRNKRKQERDPESAATPERMAKAGADVEVGRGHAREQRTIRTVDAWPLRRMFIRQVINQREFDAGERLYSHWYYSGLSPVSAIDYGRAGGSNAWDRSAMPASERQAMHRGHYRDGMQAMGMEISAVVGAIVFEERDPAEVGRTVFGRVQEQQARASAIDHLRTGLRMLASHWGM